MDALLPKFMEITNKMVQSSLKSTLPSIFSLVETENVKSTSPNENLYLTIINFSNKNIKATWIDYEGNETGITSYASKNAGSKLCITTYTNHVFKLYFDTDDAHSESIYFKLSDDVNNNTFYFGNADELTNQFTQVLNESSWINNPSLNMNHLDQIEKLVDYKSDSLTNFETRFIRSSYYDDSDETRKLVKGFFKSFNKDNKFVDPFFNPLNLLGSDVYIKRVSDYDIDADRKIIPSEYLGSEFSFTITNDTEKHFTIYWVDYSGKATNWSSLSTNSNQTISSYLGNVWAISDSKVTYVFQLGKDLFKTSKCSIKISQLSSPFDFDIETYVAKKADSIIIDKNDLEKYNARQGRIGNCWFLQTVISLYASYPDKIISAFIMPEFIETTGVVALRLWSPENKCWRLVIMDDYLPCIGENNWYCSSPSGILKNRFWVSFLEKAVAKQIGSFLNLEAGKCSFSVEDVYRMILGPTMIGYKTIIIPEKDTDLKVFNQILNHYKNKDVCGLSSRTSKNGQLIDNVTKMVSYHGYGLLEIRENVCGSGLTLVKCQNTWSKGGEWGGDWSDSSKLWDSHPDIRNELKFEKKDDGTFWIEKKDFSKAFSVVWIAECSSE